MLKATPIYLNKTYDSPEHRNLEIEKPRISVTLLFCIIVWL